MSRVETSPTSTRPPSTPNFILIPLMGTPGLSATGPDSPSFSAAPAPAPVSWLAIAKAGRTGGVHRWGTCSTTVSAEEEAEEGWGKAKGGKDGGLYLPPQQSWWRSTDSHVERFPSPFKSFRSGRVLKVGSKAEYAIREMSPLRPHSKIVPLCPWNLIAGERIKKKNNNNVSPLCWQQTRGGEVELVLLWSWYALRVGVTATGGIGRLFHLGAALEVAAIECRHLTGTALGTSQKKKTHWPERGGGAGPPAALTERGPFSWSRQTQGTCLNVHRGRATLHSLPDIPR